MRPNVRLCPHLTFDGLCQEAFQAYQRILGSEITTLLSYGESPMASQVDAQWQGRIAHATLTNGEFELNGADLLPHDYRKPQGLFVTLSIDGTEGGREVIRSLAEGGQVQLPFASTFWSPGFGVLVDRYDLPWEINCG